MRLPRRGLPWIVLAIALAARLVFLAQYRANPLFDRPIIDARTYHEWAVRIATGEGFGSGAFARAPFYPTFLGIAYRTAGIGPALRGAEIPQPLIRRAIFGAKARQVLLGSLSALFVYLIGARLFGRREGMIAGILFALHPVLIFYTGELFLETLAVFQMLAGLCVLAFAAVERAPDASGDRGGASGLDRDRAPARRLIPHGARFAFAGILLGLSAITRPTILPAAFALPIALFVVRRPLGRALRESLLYTLGLAAAIAPVTIHNVRASGDFVLISSQGGVNLWIGNNPDADGRSALSPGRGRTATPSPAADIIDVAARQIAEETVGRPMTDGEVSDFWGARAKAWIAGHPADFARLTLRKLGYFWGGAEIWDQQCDLDLLARFSPFLRATLIARPISLPTGLVMPFAAVGLVLCLGALRRSWLIVLFFVLTLGGVLLFAVTSRYRLPTLPFLFLFAAVAAGALTDRWRAGGLRAALPLLAVLALLAIVANLDARYTNPTLAARGRVFVANAWLETGAPDRAVSILEEGMRIDPAAADPWYALGLARLAQNDTAAARRAFEETLARDPQFERAQVNLGNLRAQTGDWAGAIDLYESALAVMPGDDTILANLFEISREASRGGRPELAVRALRRVLASRPDDPAAMNALAWNLAERMGRAADAVPLAERAAAASPGAPEIRDTLGWALLLAGETERALPQLRAALAGLPGEPDVALHLGVALALAAARGAPGVAPEDSAASRALLDRAFSAPGGAARRARAAALLGR